MTQFLEWLANVFSSWKPWIVVPPWDVGVRVRLGKKAAALAPGLHFRVPLLDEVILVNTRLRVVTVPPVTVAGSPGKCRTIMATVGFYVRDPLAAMMRFDQPTVAIQARAQSELARCGGADACLEALIGYFSEFGIDVDFLRYVEDVEVLAVRVLNASWGVSSDTPQQNSRTPGERY